MTITAPRLNPALMAQVRNAPRLNDGDMAQAARNMSDRQRAQDSVDKTNEVRAEHGLRPLTVDEVLAELEKDRLRRVSRDFSNRYGR